MTDLRQIVNYIVLFLTTTLSMISFIVFAPSLPTYVQNELASIINGTTIYCQDYHGNTIPEACIQASQLAPSIQSIFALITAILGSLINPLIGYLSDILGRRLIFFILSFMSVFPLTSFLLYQEEIIKSIFVYMAINSIVLSFDSSVISNALIVDITPKSSREKIISYFGLGRLIGLLIIPLAAFIDKTILVIILLILTIILLPTIFILPKSTISIHDSLNELKIQTKKQPFFNTIRDIVFVHHSPILMLCIITIFIQTGDSIIQSTITYFIQISLDFMDSDRIISLVIISISTVIYLMILLPFMRKYKSLMTCFIIFISINIPVSIIKVLLPEKISYFIFSFLIDGNGLMLSIVPGMYIATTISLSHQGIVQGLHSSSKTIGTCLGNLFVLFGYQYFEQYNNFIKYIPFLLVCSLYACSSIFAILMNKYDIEVSQKEELEQLVIHESK